MAESKNEVAALTERLRNLPIYPILENSDEKNNLTVLQFMCILDFHMTESNLYARINESKQPKLLGQLLQFRRFEKFQYNDYQVKRQFGNYILQCKYCPLVGPCRCILTHMIINHNVHSGVVICVFCNSEKLKTHIDNNSLEACNYNYIQQNNIETDENVLGIVTDFYDMLKKLSKELNLYKIRNKAYAGSGYKSKERLVQNYGGDISEECEVRYMLRKDQRRSIQSEALSPEFHRITDILYGGNYERRSKSNQKPINYKDIVVIDTDSGEDDQEVNRTTENSNALTYGVPSPGELSIDDMIPENLIKREPRFNNSPIPSVSLFPIPMDRTSVPNYQSSGRPSTAMSVSSSYNNWSPRNESEEFALNIARKIEKIPQGSLRRQLEISIEMAILNAEKKAIEEGAIPQGDHEHEHDF